MSLNNRLVTTFYTEGSTTQVLEVSRASTILDLRRSIHAKAQEKFRQEWGNPTFHPDPQSILITTNLHGSDNFTDGTAEVGDLCDFDDQIYAVVPSCQRSSSVLASFAALRPDTLSRPLHDNLRQHKMLLELYEGTLEKREEERRQEKADREEERKRERAEYEEERKRERAERERQDVEREAKHEEERRQEKAERKRQDVEREVKREAERRQEREEIEEERRREKREWKEEFKHELEERDRKYEDLRQHLLEVEETTMDAVGWLAGNDTNMLDRIKLRHLLNVAQERLALAAGLVDDRYGASLSWREALGPSQDLSTRFAKAHELLDKPTVRLDARTRHLMASDGGMRLVVEYCSYIRDRGDKVAHPMTVSRGNYEGPVLRHPFAADTQGLMALTNFVCT